ncbi:hypothetical protein DFH06DRAFT_1338051 [Mycena polygramma]|nr:hypothetical protein DFH06DRAFT_1338051 [Mycena polygramma]
MATQPPAADSSWRKNGHQYKDVPASVQAYVRQQLKMSQLFRGIYLPHEKLSVVKLAEFTLPPMSTSADDYKIPAGHNFFTEDGNEETDLELLMEIQVPPVAVLTKLAAQARQQYLDGAESIRVPGTRQPLPLWVLDLFIELQLTVKPAVDAWAKGIKWLQRSAFNEYPREIKQALRSLATLSWKGSIPLEALNGTRPGLGGDPVESLTRYLLREWFSSLHMDQMTDLILVDIRKKGLSDIQMMKNSITTEILVQYRKNPRDYDPNGDRFLQCFGKSLKDHSEFAGMFHVRTNHWVGAAVDLLGQSIEYGDPGGDEIEDVDVCDALQWFVDQHRSNSAELPQAELPCTKQEDSHNCGLYGPNAIAHRFLPDEHPLYSADLVLGDLGRLDILQRLIAKFHDSHGPAVKAAPHIIAQRLHEYMNTSTSHRRSRSLSSTPPSTPPPQDDVLSNALRQLSVSPKKRPSKRRKTEGSQQRPPIAPIFKLQPKPAAKKSVNKVVKRESQSSKKPLAAGQAKKEARVAALKSHQDAARAAMPADLPVEDQPTSGRPRSEEMDNLTVEVESKFKTGTRAYRCAGTGCIKIFNPRTLARVLAHGKRCTFVTATQRQYASKHSADTSPGARAEQLAQGLSAEQLEPPALPVTEFFGSAGAAQVREHLKAKLDLAIVKLFCAAGLPPRLADYPEYKEVLRLAALAGPRYTPAGRTILMDNHIMSEQERVRGLQLAVLRSKTRLTVSFDGGDTRLGENFYTVHASTHDGRSFLLEGQECTSVSHTAEWMAAMVMEVMETVGVQRFIGASSDNTGNTRGCRRILCDKIPTMLNLPDPNHHLNNMIKDILKIPYFRLTIKILRTTIKTFNQSKHGPGLESIGKTRFATVTLAAISLKRNMRHIRTLCTNGQVEIKKYNSYFVQGTPKSLDFEIKLSQVIAVTEGAAKAITCLESASCTPADVYLLWLAVTAHLRDALADSLLPQGVCDEIRGIVNQRWKEFFVTNPGHGAYEAAFYLNPKYVNSSIFKKPNAVASGTITIPGSQPAPAAPIGVRNAKTFFAVGAYLYKLGVTEVEHGIDPVLVAFRTKRKTFTEQFKLQWTAYAQGAYPFNTPLGDEPPMKWWERLEGSEHGGIIASLALKLYSAVPHSMADERTVSVVTWMNPALRNLEKVNTIFGFTQIRGWYRDVAKQKAEGTGVKARAGARPNPEVKFYNIEREIHGTTDDEEAESDDEEDIDEIIDSDDEFDTANAAGMQGNIQAKQDWLDEPRQFTASSASLDLDSQESELNLGSALLRDILSDRPVVESDEPAVRVGDGHVAMEDVDEDDGDFGDLKW